MGRCVNHSVQLHGGYGLMKEYDIERFYRDHKLLEIGEGTSEVQRIVISRLINAV
jgi:alkylation response protein AidB-like acyl-CoA dehydrogenase